MPSEPKKLPSLRDARTPEQLAVFQREVREIIRRLWVELGELEASLTIEVEEVAATSGVTSVTAGSSAVVVSPTTGAVVVDVAEANFSGIPQTAVTNLVADLAARPTGTGSSDTVARWTSAGVLGNSSLLDTGSHVTSQGSLQVNGDASFFGADVTIDVTGTVTLENGSDLLVHSPVTLSDMTEGSVLFAGAGGLVSQDNANLFWDDAANRFGVGTSTFLDNSSFGGSTVAVMEVSRDGAGTHILASSFGAGSGADPGFFGVRGRGTKASPQLVQSGDMLAQFSGSGFKQSAANVFSNGGGLAIYASDTWTNTSTPARLTLRNVASGATALSDRMTIVDDGTLIVGSPNALTKAAFTTTQAEFTRDANNQVTISSYGTSVAPAIGLFRGRGTGVATTAVGSGDVLGHIAYLGATTPTLTFSGALITATATQAWTGTNNGTKLEFSTTGNSGGGRAVRLTLDQDGTATFTNNIAVNGNATIGNAAGDAHTVNGSVDFNQTINVDGSAAFNGNVSLGNAAGDAHTLLGTLNLNATAGSNGQIAQVSGGVPIWGAPSIASIPTGSGSTDYIPKWLGASTLGSSGIASSGANELHFEAGTDAAATGYINFYGVGRTGITQFRNLIVADGKGATIATFVGASKLSAFSGPVTMADTLAVGGAIVGNGGRLTLEPAAATQVQVDWKQTGQTQWSWFQPSSDNGFRLWNGVSGDTLTLTDAGSATFAGTLTVNGDCTLGNATTDVHTANGTFSVTTELKANYITPYDAFGGIYLDTSAAVGNVIIESDDVYVGDPAGTEDGDLYVRGAISSTREFIAPQITANQNNYNPTAGAVQWNNSHSSILYVNSDAARDITGLQHGTGWDGRHVWIYNTGAFAITLKHQSGLSSAEYKFHGVNNADVVLQPKEGRHLYWSDHMVDWIVLA